MADQQELYKEKELLEALRKELNGKIEELTIEIGDLKVERNDLFVERDELTKTNQELGAALDQANRKAQETAYRLKVVSNGIATLAQSTAFVGGVEDV